MILTSNPDPSGKDFPQSNIIVNRAAVPDDPPPAYFKSQSPIAGPSVERSLPPVPSPIPDSAKPINFLSLSRPRGSIKGTYVIDPRIDIPQSLLPPLAADEISEATRRNVYLHAGKGSINVDLFVVGDGPHHDLKPRRRVDIMLNAADKSIKARLHASSPSRLPINLKAQAKGSITLHIPRFFHGPVTVRTRKGSLKIRPSDRDGLAANLTTFSEANHTHRCFVGDFSDWVKLEGPEEWGGDEIEVESFHGKVKLQYDSARAETKGRRGRPAHGSCGHKMASCCAGSSSGPIERSSMKLTKSVDM
ncbi:hypothetical protein B0H19DRAFT_1129878 [Mycena capillaripes]|nr:hypothetical protein B0H19DRAFT_1129878 [Mycena capillaripes]